MGTDNQRRAMKHRGKVRAQKGNGLREQLERIWEDPIVRAPGHVVGHLTEVEAVRRDRGFYRQGRQFFRPVDGPDGTRKAGPVPEPDGIHQPRVNPHLAHAPTDELVHILGRKVPPPKMPKIEWE